jgi:hypothetical protein
MNLAGNVFGFAPAIRGGKRVNFCFVSFFGIICLFGGMDFQARTIHVGQLG